MEALSGLDASFLFLETEKIPMHIGGVAILEGSMKFQDFFDYIQQRVHLVPKLRQKLVYAPLNLDQPSWVEDPEFDLHHHIRHTKLPAPGGWKELRYLASQLFSNTLNREQPLWEFIFVEGLDTVSQVPKGSVALISKVHHAGFDGKSGTDLMAMLYDVSPIPRPIPAPQLKHREEIPGKVNMMVRSAFHLASKPGKLPGLIWETGKATFKAGYLAQVHGIKMPTLPFSAPKTPFNDTVEQERKWNSAMLDLNRVKSLRHIVAGATLNDVILTICAGALRRYLLEKDKLPDKPLVAMVPVSTRTKHEKNAMGNQVSAMYIQLATDIENPIKRLEKIHINTLVGKLYQDAIDAKSLMGFAEMIPFGLAGVATRFYSRAALAKHHNPFFNLVITNVPGPNVPLYLGGHKLLANMGAAPIFDGMGLIIPVFSYNGTITISPTSAMNLMPDLDVFTKYLLESANEMESAVLEKQTAMAAFNALLNDDKLQ
ncbi:wax ester/triacylglycerol synthase family O-acyltransferase [Aliiglaciecola sp. LCG003]|uniref:WS/DGAT/MGAT family O-acyltransferase n=1 Tax=Aliiglaciecola sp. LCG003 TaxID=3053655 RepID=UPI0025733769|nr:wax ester/triacylglycerol synthase family O-acyltransferase [Aliiglaciecola sp. LCG003]WJG10213.1 wax ester/triacylglycerol synthase family O-acyltransferase [Aliiglaciecola sp. LCG003]